MLTCCACACISARALLGAASVTALTAHGESSERVASNGLYAIGHLAANNPANRTRLGESGACAGVWPLVGESVCMRACVVSL